VAARVAADLRDRESEVVLAVGHVPAQANREREALGGDIVRMAQGIDDVDAWFGGHNHVFVEDEVNGKPVLIAGSSGRAVAVCDLVIDPVFDRVVETHYHLQETWHDEITASDEWLTRVDRWNENVAPIAATVIGRSARDLDRRGPESTIGNMIADAIREASGADIAMQNFGGMRANLVHGEVTRGAVYAIMPFDNTIVTVDLTGEEVKIALDEAMRRGRVTQVSGLRYTFDADQPEMQRIQDVLDATGNPLDPQKTYTVACNNFMATGGDDYDTLSHGANKTDSQVLLRGAIEDYIRKRSANGGALDVSRDGRIQRIEAAVPVGSSTP
jgi:5'-nucleotidase